MLKEKIIENKEKYFYLNVALPLPLENLYTYKIKKSDFWSKDINLTIGCRVIVSFRNRNLTGFVISTDERTTLKKVIEIDEIIDFTPILNKEILLFLKWIADYYISSLGNVIKLSLPNGMLKKSDKIISLSEDIVNKLELEKKRSNNKEIDIVSQEIIKVIYKISSKSIKLNKLYNLLVKEPTTKSMIDYRLKKLETSSFIKIELYNEDFKIKPLKRNYIKNLIDVKKLKHLIQVSKESKLIALIKFLENESEAILLSELKSKHNFSDHIIKKAIENNYCEKLILEKERIPSYLLDEYYEDDNKNSKKEFTLTDEQNNSIKTVLKSSENDEFNTFLLHGVTGSGKTAVYIEVLKKIRKKNQTAIVLVPEIALTPQTVKNFRDVFGNEIAVLHSRLSNGERFDSWRKIQEGKYPIVIGPRSALFAPLKNIGAIIVDEEHEATYKQMDSSPRYNARNAAIVRGKLNSAVVILGSATPSLDSYYNAVKGKFKLLKLQKRVPGANIPKSELVPFSKTWNKDILEQKVLDCFMDEIYNKHNKVIIFQNRRGYSSFLQCKKCKETIQCPNCSVTLTYHSAKKALLCHHCGHFERAVDVCKSCGDDNLVYRGIGTEQIEEEMQKLFSDKKIVRMDQDTTGKKDSHHKLLNEFEQKDSAILVGTQMIAKGLDIHDVTVVCVVNVDFELSFPDFRSDEKVFQLITQVSGRAGRGVKEGKVFIQSSFEDNAVLNFALKHDYVGFYDYEIKNREAIGYPPFYKMAKISFSSPIYDDILKIANLFYDKVIYKTSSNSSFFIYRPIDNMIAKINKVFKINVLLKSSAKKDANGSYLKDIIKKSLKDIEGNTRSNRYLRISIDIDPLSMN